MPQPFGSAVVTRKGLELLTKTQSGEIKLQFTKIAVGNGSYSTEERDVNSLQERLNLKSQKNEYPLSNIRIMDDHTVRLTALITNQNPVTKEVLVSEGYYLNEIAVFAKPQGASDSEETLYSIAITSGINGDFMPEYNGNNPSEIIQDYFIAVSNSADIKVTTAGAVMLVENAREMQEAFDKQMSVKSIVFLRGNWTSSAPYTQEVILEGVETTDTPIVGVRIDGNEGAEAIKAMKKSYACIDRMETLNGKMKAYCYQKKPISDVKLWIKGV